MTKEKWQAHIKQTFTTNPTKEQIVNHARFCSLCQARQATKKKNEAARARHELMTSFGLIRVKGSLGGTYYE